MKSTSQITDCIACGSNDVAVVTMGFMGEDAEFPICEACGPYLERVFSDPSLFSGYIQFLGVTEIQHARQRGGAFSCAIADGNVPADFAARMADFDVYCSFVGQRIRALRSSENE